MLSGIVVSDPSDWTARSLISAFGRRGEAGVLNFSDLVSSVGGGLHIRCGNIDLAALDCLIVRDMGRGSGPAVAFRFEALRALEDMGILVVNSTEAIARAANKFSTSIVLQMAGVRTPATIATSSIDEAEAFLMERGALVSKPLFGYKGRGIELIKDPAGLARILDTQGLLYLQEFIPSESPRDIRAFVVGDRVAGAIYRNAPPGEWISNLARGGRAEPCEITEEVEDIAIRATMAVGAVYSGVDLIETPDGPKVIEVNGTPSGRGIFEALGVDVGEMIAEEVLGDFLP